MPKVPESIREIYLEMPALSYLTGGPFASLHDQTDDVVSGCCQEADAARYPCSYALWTPQRFLSSITRNYKCSGFSLVIAAQTDGADGTFPEFRIDLQFS